MRGFNRAIIAGNLTKDPEVRYTVNKKAFARFTVAVNNRWRNANGEVQDNTDYINVVAWNNNAENAGKYLKKGSPVLIEGRIRTGSYDAKDGSGKRYTTEIWVDSMILLSSRDGGSTSGGGYQPSSGADFGAPGGYIPSDEDFGKSIGESGFSGGGFSQGFADDNNGMPGGSSEGGIPF